MRLLVIRNVLIRVAGQLETPYSATVSTETISFIEFSGMEKGNFQHDLSMVYRWMPHPAGKWVQGQTLSAQHIIAVLDRPQRVD